MPSVNRLPPPPATSPPLDALASDSSDALLFCASELDILIGMTEASQPAPLETSQSSQSSTPKSKTKSTKPKKKKVDTSVRRRLELELLRASATDLESQLSSLSKHWRKVSESAVATASDAAAAVTGGEPRWKNIVAQRQAECDASQRENKALRARFQVQHKTLRRIRKLIAERVAIAAVSAMVLRSRAVAQSVVALTSFWVLY